MCVCLHLSVSPKMYFVFTTGFALMDRTKAGNRPRTDTETDVHTAFALYVNDWCSRATHFVGSRMIHHILEGKVGLYRPRKFGLYYQRAVTALYLLIRM